MLITLLILVLLIDNDPLKFRVIDIRLILSLTDTLTIFSINSLLLTIRVRFLLSELIFQSCLSLLFINYSILNAQLIYDLGRSQMLEFDRDEEEVRYDLCKGRFIEQGRRHCDQDQLVA